MGQVSRAGAGRLEALPGCAPHVAAQVGPSPSPGRLAASLGVVCSFPTSHSHSVPSARALELRLDENHDSNSYFIT